jgi:ubiquinone/menaquinone biosynthesis C-methylase UbiE
MTVLDIGCGTGFFSVDLARMVGRSGRVIASDLQEGMLQKLRNKIRGTELEERITLHPCEADRLGVSANVDFVLAFYMVHEVPNPKKFFEEIKSISKPDGQMLVVEPPFRISKKAFEQTIQIARGAGWKPVEGPKVLLSKTVILKKGAE